MLRLPGSEGILYRPIEMVDTFEREFGGRIVPAAFGGVDRLSGEAHGLG